MLIGGVTMVDVDVAVGVEAAGVVRQRTAAERCVCASLATAEHGEGSVLYVYRHLLARGPMGCLVHASSCSSCVAAEAEEAADAEADMLICNGVLREMSVCQHPGMELR